MQNENLANQPDGLYAEMITNKGTMYIRFFDKESPATVANFIGLSEGKIDNKEIEKGTPFYDGLIFHRVIPGFMIQGGDPLGTGAGSPGYKFADEKNDLQHSKKGILSMANSGPNTNGSQFFITSVPTPHLNGRHTVFGEVIKGLDVIDSISAVQRGANDRPVEDVVIEKITIYRIGKDYKKYDAAETFDSAKKKIEENNALYIQKQKEELEKAKTKNKTMIDSFNGKYTTQASGLEYAMITTNPSGEKPQKGQNVRVHYQGLLEDGTQFDSSYDRGEPLDIPIGVGRVIPGWDEGIMLLNKGEKAMLKIPSNLAYGPNGVPGVIPGNATLYFVVELVDIK